MGNRELIAELEAAAGDTPDDMTWEEGLLVGAASALRDSEAARAADAEEITRLRADLALIQAPGALLPDAHDADWWRRTTAYWASRDEDHEAERDALAQQIAAVRAWLEGCGDRVIPNGVRLAAALSPVTPESETNR